MFKAVTVALGVFFSCALMAKSCSNSLPPHSQAFCASFKKSATCYCQESGIPEALCQDMNAMYERMIAFYGSLEKACKSQKHSSAQECIDDWNCYRKGGTDSHGNLCSGSGNACETV